MKLKVLGSSSKGNCYLLIAESGQALVLEAGVRFAEVQKAMDFKTNNIIGCLVTHEHGDHAQYIGQFLSNAVDVYCSAGTAKAFKAFADHHRVNRMVAGISHKIGQFTIMPFNVVHDAAEPFGYLINHPESGNILFLTDTYYSEFTFKGLNNILLEVNYDEKILEENIKSGRLNPSIRRRIETSHMSLQTAKELLSANDISGVCNIVLIHLSDGNSHAGNFQKEIERATAKKVTVADTGIDIPFNKTPF
nr:MBL fold metallo-hydrolase [uncultured Draconibacterium sp.]